MGKLQFKKARRAQLLKANARRLQLLAEEKVEMQRCINDALNFTVASSTNRRKSGIFSTTNRNTAGQTILNDKETAAIRSLLGDCNNVDTFQKDVFYDEEATAMTNYNIRRPIRSVTAKAKNGDNYLDFCLICGHLQTIADAKQAASSFQWYTKGKEHDSQTDEDELSSGSCVDVHLQPIFVLLKLLKFPEEECVKIYHNSFGDSNPADWFTLCGRCVKAAHKAYRLQVLIRQLEKKFEMWQLQFLSRMKTNMQNTSTNDDMSTTKILTVREQILGFYSEKFQSDPTFNCEHEPEQSQLFDDDPCETHLSDLPTSPPTDNTWEQFDANVDNPLAQSDTNCTFQQSDEPSITTQRKRRRRGITDNSTELGPTIRMKKMEMMKKKDELMAKYLNPLIPNTYRCQLCPSESVFEGRRSFVTHMVSTHRSVWESVTDFVLCDQCGKMYSDQSIRYHIQRHHRAACPHICHLCGNGFVTEASLKYHVMKHERGELEKSVNQISVCDYCGLKLKNKHGLHAHIKRFHRRSGNSLKEQLTERGEVSAQTNCKHCDVICDNFHELQLHLKSTHPEVFKKTCQES